MTSAAAFDLRTEAGDSVVSRVEQSLQVRFDQASIVTKRRSIGLATDRQTWVRIEARPMDRINGQGWNGVEAAACLSGIAKPRWFQGIAWSEPDRRMMWRADEIEFIGAAPIKPGGVLTVEPELTDAWWSTLTASLDALVGQKTTRVAGLEPITQERISATIAKVFPDVDSTIDQWCSAHADLARSNVTAPACVILDWEDWGRAPRGYDAATLRGESLALPRLADRVYRERRTDLDSRSGKLAQLYQCSKYIVVGKNADPLYQPAKTLAESLVADLA